MKNLDDKFFVYNLKLEKKISFVDCQWLIVFFRLISFIVKIDFTDPLPVVPARGQARTARVQAPGGINCRYCGKRYQVKGKSLIKHEEECTKRNDDDDEEMTEESNDLRREREN